MKTTSKYLLLISFCFFVCKQTFAQADLLSMLDSVQKPKSHEKVFATFKTTKLINAQSTETVKKNTLDFRITHRFGDIGGESGGGFHTWYGWDAISDVRLAFDYGITDKMTVGIARSKYDENIDGTFKYRLLDQTTDNKIPVSVALYENMAVTPERSTELYNGTTIAASDEKFAHRISYVNQLIIARKFNSSFSFEVLPTYMHMNFVKDYINPDNGAEAENDLFSLGAGGRIKLTKRLCIIVDYFYTFSKFRQNNPTNPYYMPLAIGIEIETGGHVFHLDFTNAAGINENAFLPYSPDSWFKGGFKFGFNISRVFNL